MARVLATASGKVSCFARQPRVAIGALGLGGILLVDLVALLAAGHAM
jgi:hypothetical protein